MAADATGIREYKGAAKATTIVAGITNTSTSWSIADSTGWPTGSVGNFIATLEQGLSTEERILCSALAGGVLTVVTRGYDNTTAVAHAATSSINHTISAIDIAEANYIANFHAATSKATPVDADEIPLADSAATFGIKKLTWANLKATLLAYFNSVTQVLTNKDLSSATNIMPSLDGWLFATGTWTYASASTITVPAGAASLYQIGDRIKWTQTTIKYGVIVAVTNTLLTIAVNTDYVVTNAAISAIFYSHQINPIGYPGWFNIAPPTFNLTYYDNGAGGQPTVSVNKLSINGREAHIHLMSNGRKVTTDGYLNMTTTSVYPTPLNNGGGTIGYSYLQSTGYVMRSSYVVVDATTPATWWLYLYGVTNYTAGDTMSNVSFHAIYEI